MDKSNNSQFKQYLDKFNGGFASGNNNHFQKYTGNFAYLVSEKISNVQPKVFFVTVNNATFDIDKDGKIDFYDGDWLDGTFYGKFHKGTFWNGDKFIID